jgi:HEAT repeat protein
MKRALLALLVIFVAAVVLFGCLRDRPGDQSFPNVVGSVRKDGPKTAGLIDRLLTSNGRERYDAVEALSELGELGIEQLVARLSVSEEHDRIVLCWALGQIGPPAENAIPALGVALQEGVGEAAISLRRIDIEGSRAIPLLVAALRGKVAYIAATQLGLYGDRATAAVPQLNEALRSHDDLLVERAHAALEKITAVAEPQSGQ